MSPPKNDETEQASSERNSQSSSSSTESDIPRVLPIDFTPTDNTVILGRGKKIKAHQGNRRLYAMVEKELEEYTNAASKTTKSYILVTSMNQVCSNNIEQVGFVKQEPSTGRWYAVTMAAARATVAQAFRDANHTHYRSSKQSKQRRRRMTRPTDDGIKDKRSSSCIKAMPQLPPLTLATAIRSVRQLPAPVHSFSSAVSNGGMSRSLSAGAFGVASVGGTSLSFFRPQHPQQVNEYAARSRLCSVVDEAVKDFAGSYDDHVDDAISVWDHPFEPVVLSVDAATLNDKEDDDDDEAASQQGDDDFFQVFDVVPVAFMRAVLSA